MQPSEGEVAIVPRDFSTLSSHSGQLYHLKEMRKRVYPGSGQNTDWTVRVTKATFPTTGNRRDGVDSDKGWIERMSDEPEVVFNASADKRFRTRHAIPHLSRQIRLVSCLDL